MQKLREMKSQSAWSELRQLGYRPFLQMLKSTRTLWVLFQGNPYGDSPDTHLVGILPDTTLNSLLDYNIPTENHVSLGWLATTGHQLSTLHTSTLPSPAPTTLLSLIAQVRFSVCYHPIDGFILCPACLLHILPVESICGIACLEVAYSYCTAPVV